MRQQSDSLLLRRALLGNAAFSTLTGVTLLAAAGPLEPTLGVPAVALRIVGLALLPFALGLARIALRETVDRSEAWLAVALDLAWVAGSALLVLGELWPLSAAGVWTVIVVADCVLAFAILQGLGLRGSARARSIVAGSDPA